MLPSSSTVTSKMRTAHFRGGTAVKGFLEEEGTEVDGGVLCVGDSADGAPYGNGDSDGVTGGGFDDDASAYRTLSCCGTVVDMEGVGIPLGIGRDHFQYNAPRSHKQRSTLHSLHAWHDYSYLRCRVDVASRL